MLYLSKPTQNSLDDYYNRIINRIETAKNVSNLRQEAFNYLSRNKIKEIICDEPSKLIRHHNAIIPLLGPNFNLSHYNKFCKIKKIKAADRTPEEITLYDLYHPEITKLKSIFNYDKFISHHKITSYYLASIHNRNTCTYCNRLYTNTIIVRDKVTNRVNNKTRLTRPQFDHWYSKSKFCILALSFYNLIPSCSTCNSTIKGDADFSLNTHTHPFVYDENETFKFNYISEDVHHNNITINYRHNSKIGTTLKAFKIKEVYNAHSAFELKDILELRYKYSENYLDTLFNETIKISISKKEIYRMIFGVEYDEIEFHKRPFSKFKKDILDELGIKI